MVRMRARWASISIFVLNAAICSLPRQVRAQEAYAALPDAPAPAAAGASQPERPSPPMREATWRSMPGDFLHDQKEIWLFPTQVARGRHWVPTIAVTGVTAGLIFADPHAMPYFQKHQKNWDDFNDVFGPLIATGEVVALPASLLAAGYMRHDQYQVSTAILAGEAYADSAIPDLAIKAITRRQRPADIPPGGSFEDTFFNPNKSWWHGSSFPSGHATGAFAVATIVAERYKGHRWVPWAVYGMATVISFSRVSSMAHFPSDVLLGAALGYTTARYQVLRPREVPGRR